MRSKGILYLLFEDASSGVVQRIQLPPDLLLQLQLLSCLCIFVLASSGAVSSGMLFLPRTNVVSKGMDFGVLCI
jgi:hypothetical protein